tara:strand:+ start:11381 stop:12331 length:951 start_codon:yes stop_codon:yes gene_type:complete
MLKVANFTWMGVVKGLCSIVIPTFNRSDKCLRAIDSCLNLITYGYEVEVVVVDDGSTDQTKTRIDELADSRVVYFYQNNSGASAARNLGVDRAKGDFILFLDSDDVFFKDRLKVVSENHEFIKNGGVVFCRIGISYKGTFGSYDQVKPSRRFAGEELSEYLFYRDGFISTPSIVLSKAAANSVRWNESLSYGDDSDYMMALSSAGLEFKMVDEVLVWVDDCHLDGRLSLAKDPDSVLVWFEQNKNRMTPLARVSYQAKHLSYHVFNKKPVLCFFYLFRGLICGCYGPVDFLKYLLRSILPVSVYKGLVKKVWRLKS